MLGNAILDMLPPGELQRLGPQLETVRLERGDVLSPVSAPPGTLYFVTDGALALTLDNGPAFAFVGREGVAGASLALRHDEAAYQISVALPGSAFSWSRPPSELLGFPELRELLYVESYRRVLQAAGTALDACCHTVEQRLARLICILQDRIAGDSLALTHGEIAAWLAVRRPGITVATHILEGEHLIRATRGLIQVLDREGLEAASHGSYRPQDDPLASWAKLNGADAAAIADRKLG